MTYRTRVATVAALVGLFASTAAAGGAAAQVTPQQPSGPVKGAVQYLKNSEGAAAKIALFDMKARIFPPLAGDQKSRLAYVDGKAETSITAGEGLTSASIEVGYVVACGVKDGGFESWIGTNQSIGSTVGAGAGGGFGGPFPWGGVGVGGSVNGQLGMSQNQVIKTAPGTIQYFPVGVKEIANPKPGEKFGVRFAEKRISVEGCIGSVDAVAYATGKLSTRYFDDAKTAYSEIIRLA